MLFINFAHEGLWCILYHHYHQFIWVISQYSVKNDQYFLFDNILVPLDMGQNIVDSTGR